MEEVRIIEGRVFIENDRSVIDSRVKELTEEIATVEATRNDCLATLEQCEAKLVELQAKLSPYISAKDELAIIDAELPAEAIVE